MPLSRRGFLTSVAAAVTAAAIGPLIPAAGPAPVATALGASGTFSGGHLLIGTMITFSGCSNPEYNGTFRITGVSDDGRTATTDNNGIAVTI